MNAEVAASESSSVIQTDDDLYPSDTIVEQAVNQHALLKHPESMDKKEEVISEDASEEVYLSPETTDESIKACLPETGIKLTAPFITSVDDTQNTHDDIRHEIPSAEKGDIESTVPKERQPEIMQTSLQEFSSLNMGDKSANDSEDIEIEHENNEINAEVSQMSSMLLKPNIEKTAEYVSNEIDEENFSQTITPPIEEKSVEQPFYEESPEAGDISAQLIAEDDSSMKTTEIHQLENKHIPLTADREGKSLQALSYEKESDNEGMSPEDVRQISEETESRNVSCADEEAELTSEPQQSYQEILEPSQIICEGANDSKENANDNSTEKEIITSTEEMLVDSSSTIKECLKEIEPEIYEFKTIRSEDGAYVDELAEHATIEATEKSSQVGLAAVTGPSNIQENDEHQTCQAEVEENETISEMIKQNQIFPESDLQEKNVTSTESISYDNANMTNAALEGDNDGVESKAEESRYSFKEQNVETTTREPYSSDQISSTDEISVPFSEKGDSAISINSDKISSLNDNRNMEIIDTEAKPDMMQEVENKREIVVETASDDITEKINDDSYMMSENQVDNLTNKATDELGLIVDSRQNISLPAEDQISKFAGVREKAYESVGGNNAIEEENDSIRSDKDPEKDSESNEEIENDGKPDQSSTNEAEIVKHLEIVKLEIEETKLDQGEQSQENSIHNDAIGPDGDAQSISTNLEPISPENNEVEIDEIMEETVSEIEQKNIENMELCSVRDVTSAEENLKDSTDSAAAENNDPSEASRNKGDDQNENQSFSVTCVQSGTEAEDTMNKMDDSEKEVDLHYTEETQSTRDAIVECFQRSIKDEIKDDKNLENTDAETNTKNSNYDEESNEYKEQEPNESNEFHLEDKSNTEEAKNQVYEEESSSNKEGTNGTVEVSQSQDECSKVDEDSIHVIEVEETIDKQHEEQEDKSPYDEHDGVLADQVKAMNAGIDSQNDNELNTSNSDGVHVQEDQTERESCKYDEMDELDTRKDKEIISQDFEQDKLVDAITSQESSPPIEPLEHNLGAAIGDPTVSQPSEIVNDEALTVEEASTAAGLEAEQHIQTSEDPEQENDISAYTIIQGASAGNLQHIRNSAIGYENSATFAEADKHGSADHLKVVDCTDDNPAENLQESESENQGLVMKEVNNVIQTNKDHNFDQLPKNLEHNNDAQNFENERAQKDDQQVLLEAGSDVEEMNVNPMEPSENTGTESDNIKVQDDVQDGEDGVCDDITMTVLVPDTKIEGEISTGFPSQSGKLDQESNADDPITSQDEGTRESSEAMQVADIHKEVSADCRVSSTDPGMDIQQENESNTASSDCKQYQEDQRGHESFENSKMDESHPEKDIELINQGFEQDSISSEMSFQETSTTIEALRQDIRTAMDDHTLDGSSEIANDEVHIVEVSKEADLETEQHNQINEETEHENEISAEEEKTLISPISPKKSQSMDVENHENIPDSTELREVNNTENEAVNSRAADQSSKTVENLSGNENTNSEISQTVSKLDEDPKVNTTVILQDMSFENRELVPESAELAEEKNTENEAINRRAEDQVSNTIEDGGNENTDLEISQKEINTKVVLEDMDVENHKLIPESTKLREEKNAENEAILDSRAANLGSNTVEDLSGNENTHTEISQKVAKLYEDPRVNTEVMPRDLSVENHEIPESVELTEENSTENEAVNSIAEDIGSNTVGDSGNKDTNLEIAQTAISMNENPVVNREAVLQVMDVENHGLIPELTELREEKNTENEAIKSRGEDLGSNTIEDLTGYENTNSEIPQKEINSDEDATVNTEIVPQDIEVESHELIPESRELREENNSENEAINIRAGDGRSENINTNSEISQKMTNLDENTKLNTEAMPQDMRVENHGFISESTELREDNNTENEAIDSIAKALGSNTIKDLSGNQNTTSEISQNEINLEEDPKVDTEVVLQDMSVEDRALVSESAEFTGDNNTENEAINSRAEDLGSNTVEDSGIENPNLEISQKEESLNENPIVNTDIPQEMGVGSHELIPESTELREENGPENEAIKCRAVGLGSNTVEDLSENKNTNSVMSQKVTDLDEDPRVDTEVVPQDVNVGDHETIPESTERREANNTENQAVNSRAEDLGSNTVEGLSGNENTDSEISQLEMNLNKDTIVNTENEVIINSRAEDLGSNIVEDLGGKENTNLEISQKEINLDEDSTVNTGVMPKDMDVESRQLIPESTEVIESPELGVHEQSIRRNEDGELDFNKPKLNMEMVVKSFEESQHKDDREGIPLYQQEANHLASQDNEINGQPRQTQSRNGILTAIEPSQHIQEWEPNDSKQEEYVSNATKSYIDGHSVDEMTQHETVETQGKQPVEPQKNFLEPSSPCEATSTTQNKEDCSVTLHDLSEEKEEDSMPEKATQRELQVSTGFDLCGDLPYIPAVEEVSNTEEYLVPGIQGAHDPQNNEMKPDSCTNNYSHEINNEVDQFQNNSQQTIKVSSADDPSIRPISENYVHTSEEATENQEETKGPEQLIETDNEEQAKEDIVEGRSHQAVKSEMTVEESKSEEDYGPHETSAYDSAEEKLVPAGSVEIAERSSEPGIYKESKKVEDEIIEEKEETNEDTESHEPEFYEIDNDANRDGKTLSNREYNTKLDECSITISKDSVEISEEPNTIVTSTSLEGEAVGEIFLQNKSGERTENEVPEDVSLREIDPGHSEVKLKLDEIPSDVHMDCQEAEKVSAAEIIASHIRQEIEAEDKLQQPSSEHQKQRPETSTLATDVNDNTFNEEALHDESTENTLMSFDNPAETICAPVEREIEYPSLEAEPSSDLEQKQDLKEKPGTMDNSVKTDPDDLSSEFQGVESSAEVESDTEDSTLERLNVKEICHLYEKRETNESSELNFKSQPISGDNLVNTCETSTESFEPVIELQREKLAISEEIGNDAQPQTVKNELMDESNPLNFEVYEAVATDASGEQETHAVNTTVSSEDRALVQPPLPTIKSCDETEKPLIADEQSANTTFSVSQVSRINNTPPTEPIPTEEKVSEQQPKEKVSNQDSNITQTTLVDQEEQLQGSYDELHQSSRLQELRGKDSVNMKIDEPVDTIDVIYKGMNVEDSSKEESESNTNEATSLKVMKFVTTSKEEITADKYNETEEKPMLLSAIDEKKGGEDFIVTHNLQDDDKKAAEEPKTKKEKEDVDHGEEDSELEPMISSRDVELKTQNKKSQHILSGMGSKMKNSISKVKKAMACASPQFSPDNVIIKLNKSKKS